MDTYQPQVYFRKERVSNGLGWVVIMSEVLFDKEGAEAHSRVLHCEFYGSDESGSNSGEPQLQYIDFT